MLYSRRSNECMSRNFDGHSKCFTRNVQISVRKETLMYTQNALLTAFEYMPVKRLMDT